MTNGLPEAVLALGGNLGDRRGSFERACRELERLGVSILCRSRLYRTRPALGMNQPDYLNADLLVRSPLRPLEFFYRCQMLERLMGRQHCGTSEPRIMDLDLIFYEGLRLDHPRLRLPHPRWQERDFVLQPLLDLGFRPLESSRSMERSHLLKLLSRAQRCIESTSEWT